MARAGITAPGGSKAGHQDQKHHSPVPLLYVIFVLVPIYLMVITSFKTQQEASSGLTLYPHSPTLNNYLYILTDPAWSISFVNAFTYVVMNVIISIAVAVPAAYGFSRYRFVGDTLLFFWFLAARITPVAVLLLPLLQHYSTIGLMDTHVGVALAHCIFTVPVAVWILEGFVSGIPRELDQIAWIDGYSRLAFFCFMASWVELILANALTTIDAKPIIAMLFRAGGPLGFVHLPILSAAGTLTILPGIALV